MKKLKITNLVIAAILAVSPVFAVNPYSANAAEVSNTMTVSPPTKKVILEPGEVYTDTIKIANSNNSKRDLKYTVHVGSFSQSKSEDSKDDYGTVDHIARSNYNQMMDWITFDKESGTVAPNGTDTVTYSINVPENAPAGGQYATILVRDESGDGDGGSGNVSIQSVLQFASIIYAEVAGETKEVGSVVENSVPGFLFGGPLTVSSMVKNEGNVHTDAEYTLQVWPLFSDEEAYTNEEEPMTSLILPESEKYNTQTWEDAQAIGIYKVKQTVKIFDNESIVEKTVIICPLWLLLIVVFVVVAIVVWLVMKSRGKKGSRKRAAADN